MKLAAAFFVALTAFGQALEVRGKVIEQGPNIPLSGVHVSLYDGGFGKELVGTVFTDANGAYSFLPSHIGTFRVEASKNGYIPAQNAVAEVARQPVILTPDRPRIDAAPIFLLQPAALTGRVVDEERKPVVGLTVLVQSGGGSMRAAGRTVVTDHDGVFLASGLLPLTYVVRVASDAAAALTIIDDSEAEFKVVDHDIETSFWPGGVSDPSATVPIRAQAGAPTIVGTITVRTVPHYRARVKFRGDCGPDEEWRVALVKLPIARSNDFISSSMSCRNAFLIRDLTPGSYSLGVWTREDDIHWALAPLVVTSENVETEIHFSSGSDLTASIVAPSGVPAPDLSKTRIQLQPENAPSIATNYSFQLDADGQFSIRDVLWQRHTFSVTGLPKTHYVKEVRYAGQPVFDSSLSISSGGNLEIIIDDHPATIVGTVKNFVPRQASPDSTMVGIVREPFRGSAIGTEPFAYFTQVGGSGSFRFSGLAPGDYRIKVGSIGVLQDSAPTGGVLVRVSAGETKTVEVTQ